MRKDLLPDHGVKDNDRAMEVDNQPGGIPRKLAAVQSIPGTLVVGGDTPLGSTKTLTLLGEQMVKMYSRAERKITVQAHLQCSSWHLEFQILRLDSQLTIQVLVEAVQEVDDRGRA